MTTILFDLDGTIINSFLGITRCVQSVSYTHLTLPTKLEV